MPKRASRRIGSRRCNSSGTASTVIPVSQRLNISSLNLPVEGHHLLAIQPRRAQELACPSEFQSVEEARMPVLLSLELEFLRGPIPMPWIIAAARSPGRSLHVGVALWVISGIHQSCIVPLTNLASQCFGLDRNSKYRGLSCLERAGLITVRRKLGQPPIVTILPACNGHERQS
jgi:hypothetical protein